jgi:hypothetical protein
VGSAGKREYSGDIDLVIEEPPELFSPRLFEKFPSGSIAKNGKMMHLKFPISQFNPDYQDGPRTGFVQVDFNFGSVEWEKLYHYSAGPESEYKGAHRNLALSAVCSVADVHSSDEVDTYNRPIWQYKWKWGPNGFLRVLRESCRDLRSGVWLKKQTDTVFKGPYYDPEFVSARLFPDDGTPRDLDSLETIISAVKRNYGMTDCERIWSRMAVNFADWSEGKYFDYPIEIARYFPEDDK